MAFPKVGNMAPAFTLQDQDGNKVSLKDFKGKKNVVLYFYPKAMTPGCTVQACGIRDSKAKLSRAGVVVLGISPDPVAKLAKFIDKLAFPMLGGCNMDTSKEPARNIKKWHVFDVEGRKVCMRARSRVTRSARILSFSGILLGSASSEVLRNFA